MTEEDKNDNKNKVFASGLKVSVAVMISVCSAVLGAGAGAVSVAVAYGKTVERLEIQDDSLLKQGSRIKTLEVATIGHGKDIAVLEAKTEGFESSLRRLEEALEKTNEKLGEKMDRVLERLPPPVR